MVWEVDERTWNQLEALAVQWENCEISEGEYAESLRRMPGYPGEFGGQAPLPGEDLRIVLKAPKPMVSVPGSYQRGTVQ